nr:unnamed protein product [Callosobruchus chinensis]
MVTEVNLRELAVGNKGLLPVFKDNESSKTKSNVKQEEKTRKDSNSKIFYTTLVEIRDRIEPVLRSSSSKEDSLKKEKDEKDKKYDEAKSRWEKERDSKEAAIKKENDIKEADVDMKAEKTDDGSKKDN